MGIGTAGNGDDGSGGTNLQGKGLPMEKTLNVDEGALYYQVTAQLMGGAAQQRFQRRLQLADQVGACSPEAHAPTLDHGVYTVGRGAVAIPLPMKNLGCGGWL
ncbi:hypothetical protein [Streptomyces sviceus]|uniref:hypothetical protein n=1 Tax=Streptomyces sviceus TaxID=285530 RepID=UPI0036DFE426